MFCLRSYSSYMYVKVVSEQKHEVVAHALCYMYLFLFLPSVTVGMRLDKLFYTSMLFGFF